MKILAFVDVHENITALRQIEHRADKADILVCAGDVTIFENRIHEIMQRLGRIKKPIYIIPGNHETPAVLKKYCSFHTNLVYMHKQHKTINGYDIIGWGGGGFSNTDEDFEAFAKKTSTDGRPTILITHAPPYGTKLDVIGREHCGNKSIMRYIKQNKNILLHICGHLHENMQKQERIGNTLIVNPGPGGAMIDLE